METAMKIKECKFSLVKGIGSEDLMYSMVTMVNIMELYIWKLMRMDLKHPQHTQRELTWGGACVSYLDLGNHSIVYMCTKLSHATL